MFNNIIGGNMQIRKKFKKTEASHIVRGAVSERCKLSWAWS